MKIRDRLQLSSQLLQKVKIFGADLAGLARVDQLLHSPSYKMISHVPHAEIGRLKDSFKPGEIIWPEKGKSILVVALSHPADKPELDWWHGNRTPPGNQLLAQVVDQASEWVKANYPEVDLFPLPYHVEKGGVFLKDAAVLAGLGCIGRHNLFVSPTYGPRVRLRGLILDQELPPTGPLTFDPCADCEAYCLKNCPQGAFSEIIYREEEVGQLFLPGRRGDYNLLKCNQQMKTDIKKARDDEETTFTLTGGAKAKIRLLKYCRNCELSCPLGDNENQGFVCETPVP